MKKAPKLPTAVQNLRRIWEAKKVEMEFNQTEAAKELGWSQGAISHYLNAITELGTPAIVKLANFLNVDPVEIDPTIVSKLPNVRKINITMNSSDVTKSLEKVTYIRDDIDYIYVELDKDVVLEGPKKISFIPSFLKDVNVRAKLCSQKQYTTNQLIAVRLKKEKRLRFYYKSNPPDPKTIHTLWAVMSLSYY